MAGYGEGSLKTVISCTRLKANFHRGIRISWSSVRQEPQIVLSYVLSIFIRKERRVPNQSNAPETFHRFLFPSLPPSSFIKVLASLNDGGSLWVWRVGRTISLCSVFSLQVCDLGWITDPGEPQLPQTSQAGTFFHHCRAEKQNSPI